MKVLSLFDGMSGTQIALKNLGINVETYYASEIDKYAIQITQKNFPDTIQLGDIKDIKGSDLPEIDLIVAGSPCQGFSFAGKQLAFDDPRSALFFEFIRVLREVKPKYFLLENVRMKKEHIEVINQQVSESYPEYTSGGLFGIEPILINSALVSAQNRNRLYWTNIPNIDQPEDLDIVLRDVLEDRVEDYYYAGESLQKGYKGGNQLNPNYKSQGNTIHDINKKSHTVSAGTHGYGFGYVTDKEFAESLKKTTTKEGKAYAITATYQRASSWNSINKRQRTMIPEAHKTPKQVGVAADINGHDILKRVYSEDGKSPTLTTMGGGNQEPKVAVKGGAIRGRAYDDKGKRMDKDGVSVADKTTQMLELRKDDKSNAITTVGKDSLVVSKGLEFSHGLESGRRLEDGKNLSRNYSEGSRVYKTSGKAATLTAQSKGGKGGHTGLYAVDDKSYPIKSNYYKSSKANFENDTSKGQKFSATGVKEGLTWRKLTPIECERLQTVPDNYTEGVSNTQRYKMLGNGFTVKVIEHILKSME